MLTCRNVSQEWPLVREVSLSYLEPTLRPADLPTAKPPRASLPSRIMRRLKNYWSPPVEGNRMAGWLDGWMDGWMGWVL